MFKDLLACKIVLAANHQNPGIIQSLFRLQNCLSRKSTNPGNSQRLSRLQKCLSRKSSKSWNYSTTFSPAKLSQRQIIKIVEMFKDFFACEIVLAANHQNPGNIPRSSRLQKSLSRKSSQSWKYSKTFSPVKLSQPQIIRILELFKNFLARKIVLAANLQNPGDIQRLSCLYNCLSRKSSKSWKYSKNFLPVKLSQPQIITILKIFKDLLACKIVLAANHQNPGNIQRHSRLLKCLSRKSSKSWKYSMNFSPVKLAQPQIINILKIFKDFFACKIVLAATQQNPGNVQRPSRL